MPIHHIELNIPAAEIMNTDAVFKIWSDEELLGELCLSRGSIDWRPGPQAVPLPARLGAVRRDDARARPRRIGDLIASRRQKPRSRSQSTIRSVGLSAAAV